jgi:predicted AAA+ superfamily ATPase
MQNFWEFKDWEKEDKHLLSMKEMPFKRIFPEVELKEGLYSIRGPRQIGKSSWVKTLLSKSCKEIGPEKCFYLSCENIENHQ